MKNTARFFIFLLFLTLAFFLPAKISAQNASDRDLSKPNQNWQCFNVKRTGSHSVSLTADSTNMFPPPNSPVYVVECISTKQGTKCTTGQCDTDTALVGNCNDLNWLRGSVNYQRESFSGSQPSFSDFEGRVGPFNWTSSTLPSTGHTFFGVGVSEPTVVGDGQWPTLQLGTFYFPNSSETCAQASMRWDPYGRVFDSVSLEPIPNVNVTLFQKINAVTQQVVLPGLTNPQLTGREGSFNFVVPDGTYVLSPQIATHTFPNNPARLHPSVDRLYSDIYRGEDIVQQGFIQHRDIPVDPVGAPFTSPVVIEDYGIILDKLNSKLIISGAVSHPLALVRVYSAEKFLKQVTASKFGEFKFILDDATIDQSQPLRLEVVKSDFSNDIFGFWINKVYAQDKEIIELLPIMNNIEGYAFNNEGDVIPGATVTVKLQQSDNPFFTVTADSIGFFNIPSQYLPPLSFYIEIQSPNDQTYTMETTEFASHNTKYAQAASVNFGTYSPQVPGETANSDNADNIQTDEDGNITRTVIGPDGKLAVITEKNGTVSSIPEEGQIVTDMDEIEENGGPITYENPVAAEENSPNSKLFVLLFVLLFAVIGAIFFFRRNRLKPRK